jgi:hypothetical protein
MKNTILVTSLAAAFYAALHFNGGVETIGLFAALLFLIVSILVSITADRTNPADSIIISPVGGTLVVYFLWIAISIPFSVAPFISFQVGAYLVSLPLGYLALACCASNEKIWEQSFFLIKIMAAVVMGLAILEFAIWRDRTTSVFVDFNILAAFCNVMLLPAISLAFRKKMDGQTWQQVFLSGNGLFVLAGLAVLVTTASRAGLISFAATLAVLTLILGRQSPQAYVLAGFVVVGLVAVSPLSHLLPGDQRLLSRVQGASGDQSISDRVEMLRSAWTIYQQHHPLTGIGLGAFKLLYPAVRSPHEISSGGELLHNDYAQFLLEGGPLLASLLLALAGLSAWRVYWLWKHSVRLIGHKSFVEAAGLSCGLLGLFIHALPNFIFYAAPLSMLAGFYLARLDILFPIGLGGFKLKLPSLRLKLTLAICALVFIVATLGLQAGFVELTEGKCQLQICKRAEVESRLTAPYASLLAATQPSYLPARNWLVTLYTTSAQDAADTAKSANSARLAASELSDIVMRAPVIGYPYRQLGELIQKYPAATSVLPPALPHDAAELFRNALLRDPLDTTARLDLAAILEKQGKLDQAFSLVFDDGMRWWKVELLPDSGRFEMLRYAMPLASRLGRCKDALEMAHGLLVFEADNAAAKRIIENSADFVNDHLGSACEKESAAPAA